MKLKLYTTFVSKSMCEKIILWNQSVRGVLGQNNVRKRLWDMGWVSDIRKFQRASFSAQFKTIDTQFTDLFSEQVAKSPIFVCSNFPENNRWPSWVETQFSKWPDYQIRRNLGNCRLTISNTILFSKFLLLLARKWSRSWQLINFN